MLDAAAVVLLRCAETGRSYWAWTEEEWAGLLGQDQHGFRKAAPGWADDAVRPYLATHAFLLGGFTAFYRLGSFSRLTLAWRVFGRARVDGKIGRIRSVLAGWGYRLGRDDDQLLSMVACQVLLLKPKLRLIRHAVPALAWCFAVLAGFCCGYFKVSGIGAPRRSKACRWAGVGSASMGTVRLVPVNRTWLRVRVARWASRPRKLR